MKIRRLRLLRLFLILCIIGNIAIIQKPFKTEAVVNQAGYNETTTNMTKYVGDTYTVKTDIDGVATWTSSDPSIARIDSYDNSSASMTFLKVGQVSVTFQNTYTYIKPVFDQTGTSTGVWSSERCQGITIVHLNIEVKEGFGTSLFAGGSGTEQSPYLVSTKEQLANINDTALLNKYFKLTNDIVFSPEDFEEGGEFYNDGCGWFPLGFYIPGVYGQAFKGEFDGDGHVISGLKCYYNGTGSFGRGYFGLFGVNDGTIKNLGIENSVFLCYSASDATNELEYVGGISGYNSGFIDSCYVKNCTIGGNCAGGIIGYQSGFLSRCYSAYNTFGITELYLSHIKGFTFGGLVGAVDVEATRCTPTIYDCYTANLNFMGWTKNIGSLAGYLIYNTEISDCYYNNTDVNAFYTVSGTRYTKKLTEDEMKKQSSFPGLNFSTSWIMDSTDNYLYPKLKKFVKLQQALYVSSLPSKSIYFVGDKLDLSGGEISFTNSEGKTYTYPMTDAVFNSLTGNTVADVQKGTISDVDMSTTGTKTITVEYMGQKAEFQIYVIDSKMLGKLDISCPGIISGGTLEPKVNSNDSQANVVFKYYTDAECHNEIAKPSVVGTYYVRAYTEETDYYQAAASNVVQFGIKEPHSDVNKDGNVDIMDIAAVSRNYNMKKDNQGWIEGYDLNSDGQIDIFDLVLISKWIDQ